MLVLSRKREESVVVGGSMAFVHLLKVTVLRIEAGYVKLGFEANKEVPVYREEVWERIRSGGQRDPPIGGRGRTELTSATGKACVLSGRGKGRSPKSLRDRVSRKQAEQQQ